MEEHHIEVYAGKDNPTIQKADDPKSLLKNRIITPSLAASIMNTKYVNEMPIYRICQKFIRNDIHTSKQVMANRMIQCGEKYFAILYDYLREILYNCSVVQADEILCNMAKAFSESTRTSISVFSDLRFRIARIFTVLLK